MTELLVSVLVVDDDPQIVRALRINLAAHDYHVLTATDGTGALQAATDSKPDAVILDLGLPDLDGMEVITRLRAWTTVPIVVLSARTQPVDKIRALDAGADDYVTKPFRMDELLARLRATRRRAVRTTEPGETTLLDTASFSVDLVAKKVLREGAPVHLTRTEWELLEILVRHHGRLVTQGQLLQQVWGPDFQGNTHYLRVYLSHLRQKLEPEPAHPRHFITETGIGYRLEP
jgi:two-component system, OmpR family, KDP operon response regulator KdpE